MPTTSSLLSVLILVITLLGVVAFAFAEQMVRYVYLQQLSEKIARTQEVVSVGVWSSKTIILAEVKNNGGRGVLVKSLNFVVTCRVEYAVGGQRLNTSITVTKTFNDILLRPYKARYLAFDIAEDVIKNAPVPPSYIKDITITYITAMVSTERNSFVYDPAPPTTATVLEISRNHIGSGFNVVLPNGKIAQIRIYEYLFCGVGSPSRLNTYVSKVGEITKVMVAFSPNFNSVSEGFYQFGYDYEKNVFPSATININPLNIIRLKNGEVVNTTICSVSVPGYQLGGLLLSVSRGLILLGTQFSGYDIVAVLFVKTPYPRYIDPSLIQGYSSSGVTLTPMESTSYVNKIPLPSSDISVLDFLGPQVTPFALPGSMNYTTVLSVGNYYSQAVLIGTSFTGLLSGTGSSIDAYVEFEEPYPIIVVIAPPPVEV